MEGEPKGHPESQKGSLDAIANSTHWDTARFEQTLLALAPSGGRNGIENTPQSIDLSGWKQGMDHLWNLTATTGNEHGQVFRADLDHNTILSGTITEGTQTKVSLDHEKDTGREHRQVFVATLHTHRSDLERGIHRAFSTADFVAFLLNRSEQAMIIRYGPHEGLLALKSWLTNSQVGHPTPGTLEESIRSRVETIMTTHTSESSQPAVTRVIEANKAVCRTFSLSLYRMTSRSGLTFERIEITP